MSKHFVERVSTVSIEAKKEDRELEKRKQGMVEIESGTLREKNKVFFDTPAS